MGSRLPRAVRQACVCSSSIVTSRGHVLSVFLVVFLLHGGIGSVASGTWGLLQLAIYRFARCVSTKNPASSMPALLPLSVGCGGIFSKRAPRYPNPKL